MSAAWIVLVFNIAAAIINFSLLVSLYAARKRADFELKWVMNARKEIKKLQEDAAAARLVARFDRNTWKFAKMSSEARNDLPQKEKRKS